MARVDRAVLGGRFGFVVGGAATADFGGVAIDLLEEGSAAIRNLAMDDAQRAGFADGGAQASVLVNRQRVRPP